MLATCLPPKEVAGRGGGQRGRGGIGQGGAG